jgi:hypothetical protein
MAYLWKDLGRSAQLSINAEDSGEVSGTNVCSLDLPVLEATRENNTGTSRFSINLSNSTSNLSVSGNYTVFGKVISGWSVVEATAARNNVCNVVLSCPSTWQVDEPIKPVFIDDIVIQSAPPTGTSST